MPEYKYVSLPTDGKEIRSSEVERYASEELNRVYAADGWRVVSVTRAHTIGPIGFALER